MTISIYYIILLLLSFTWPAIYMPEYFSASAFASHALQLISIYGILFIADSYSSSKKFKFIAAGSAFAYMLFFLFNALLLSITSITFIDSMKIFSIGVDFLFSMEEAGFPWYSVILAPIGLSIIIAIGGYLYKLSPKYNIRKRRLKQAAILVLIILSSFIIEQIVNRNSSSYFARREYPLYIQIFSRNRNTLNFKIPQALSENEIQGLLKNIGPAKNQKNIIYIVLESFRYDMINDSVCPNLSALARDSLQIRDSYGDAIYTSLSWNTIFFDRPAWTVYWDIVNYQDSSPGALPLRIFKKAGYDILFSASANMNWNRFYARINGSDQLLDKYYSSFDEHKARPRNEIDNFTTDKAVSWIKDRREKKPYLMFVHLDSTHWTYYFDKNAEIFKPYPETINMVKLVSEDHIGLVFNRYKNSARQVDDKIGEIISALKSAGEYGNTIIAVVSDHGEGFAPGIIGHSVLTDDIKKIPIIIKLPGMKSRATNRLASHRDIFPTLLDYTAVKGAGRVPLLGKSLISKNNEKTAVLTLLGSTELADLTTEDLIISFKTEFTRDRASLTPFRYRDRSEKEIQPTLAGDELNKILTKIIEKR